jgi:hypothetical protein
MTRLPFRRHPSALFVATLLATAAVSPAHAQSSADQAHAMAFLDSLAMPARAAVCAEKQPGYQDRFQPAFARWREAHQADIAAGEATMRQAATSAGAGATMDSDLKTVTQRTVDLLRAAPPEKQQQECDGMLKAMADTSH